MSFPVRGGGGGGGGGGWGGEIQGFGGGGGGGEGGGWGVEDPGFCERGWLIPIGHNSKQNVKCNYCLSSGSKVQIILTVL